MSMETFFHGVTDIWSKKNSSYTLGHDCTNRIAEARLETLVCLLKNLVRLARIVLRDILAQGLQGHGQELPLSVKRKTQL